MMKRHAARADLLARPRNELSRTAPILLTGTGVVPPDDFTLAVGDVVHIEIAGIGRLTNPVRSALDEPSFSRARSERLR